MKYAFFLMAASIGLLAGCSQMEQDFAGVNSRSDGDLVEKVIFEVLPIIDGDNPETKASAVPNGGTVGFIWEASDTVGIYPDKGSQVYFNIEDGVGTSSVSFTGGGWALKQNSTYVSYYPFVGDIYMKRDEIPVSFAGQKQIGTRSPFVGARYYLATEASTSENGVLRFSYSTLNTIIDVNATLPAGTYTKMSLTIEEPLFIEEGTYSLDDRTIVGTKFTNTLEIELEDVVLTEEATIPIYIMSAPVDLKGKEITVRIISSDGLQYECVKTPSKAYEAGTRYGLTCDRMTQSNVIFDDENFKAYCVENFDLDGDGEVSYAEAKVVTYMNVNKKGISSLKGIENFTALETLGCGSNQLTSLDVSQNTALTYLNCNSNRLTSLDVSHNTALRQLYCDSNQLTSLDVSQNTALEYLDCRSNQLTNLDVSQNSALTSLSCDSNQLTSLDVSHNTALEVLDCTSNQLTSFDVSQNTALEELYCQGIQLTSLDVSQNTALIKLSCGKNQLTSLDVSQNTALKQLRCHFNQLTSLDVSNNTALEVLYCYNNQLTSIDVSQNSALKELVCYSNQLTNLDVSNNTALEVLYCYNNQLTSLDVGQNSALTSLSCDSNQLTSLDVSHNTALTSLGCSSNKLTSLDVSQNTALKSLTCEYNQLTSLDVSHNTALTSLKSSSNKLTSLDVSQNASLKYLYCQSNQLMSLDVSQNAALNTLYCQSNQLMSLDVSQNTALAILYCSDNPSLSEIWLKTGQTISGFTYDTGVATIKFKD